MMKQPGAYFLLVLFCINIFGASLGKVLHWLDHTIYVSHGEYNLSSEQTSIYYHTHDGDTHEHGLLVTTLLSRVFNNVGNTEHPLNSLSLLMLVLNALIIGIGVFKLKLFWTNLSKQFFRISKYLSIDLDVPIPPPKFFS